MLSKFQTGWVRLTRREKLSSVAISAGIFLGLGTLTALWQNPFFIRMTPISAWDFVILGLEALLLGLYLGIRSPACGIKRASIGGVLGFLGFGCSICNKILMLIFGASFLLIYFEPYRYLIGFLGIALIAIALQRKLVIRAVVGSKLSD